MLDWFTSSLLKKARRRNRRGYDRLAKWLGKPDALPHELARLCEVVPREIDNEPRK